MKTEKIEINVHIFDPPKEGWGWSIQTNIEKEVLIKVFQEILKKELGTKIWSSEGKI